MHQAHTPSTDGTTSESDAHSSQHDSLRSTTFIGLLLTQFLGATNDNILRWLVIGIGKEYVDKQSRKHGAGGRFGLPRASVSCSSLRRPAIWPIASASARSSSTASSPKSSSWRWRSRAILIGNMYFMFVVVALIGCAGRAVWPGQARQHSGNVAAEQDLVGQRPDRTDDRDRHRGRHRRRQLAGRSRRVSAGRNDGGSRRSCWSASRLPAGSPACSSCRSSRRIRGACSRGTWRSKRFAI